MAVYNSYKISHFQGNYQIIKGIQIYIYGVFSVIKLVSFNNWQMGTMLATWTILSGLLHIMQWLVVVAKEVFNHRNSYILKLWEWPNDENQFILSKFIYMNKHFYLAKNCNYL